MSNFTLLVIFNIAVVVLLVFDLFIFHRKAHTITVKEALWSASFWIFLALAFAVGVYFLRGHDAAMKFLAGYVIEESLSVDNLFVFLVIFPYFKVSKQLQHRVLFWGIVGALVMRAAFIAAGVAIIHYFEWVMYLFGAFLIFTGFKLVTGKEEKEVDPQKNPIVKAFKKIMPVTNDYAGESFFTVRNGRLWATPLMVVLIVVETTDIIFAIDSIPAVLSITTDPFIVYTSNIFAILGLRSIFFALSGLMDIFHYLHYGLGIILAFVGLKMLISGFYEIPTGAALAVIGLVLLISIIVSIIKAPPSSLEGEKKIKI